MHILVIDDEVVTRRVTSAILSKSDHTVYTQPDGAAAIKVLFHEQFDFIFTDLEMPNIDGFYFAKIARGLGYQIPIVALSAKNVTYETCRPWGLTDLVPKPPHPDTLLRMIDRHHIAT